MASVAWTPVRRWTFAIKLAGWPRLLVPMTFGLVLGMLERGEVRIGAVPLVLAFTVADLVFIVLLNDVADERVDTLKRRMFPDAGAPKTLVDGVLDRQTLLIGATVAGTYALVTSAAGAFALGRPGLLPGGILCLALFLCYSVAPVRMNYRGGGEALEALGVGIALPWYAAYALGAAPDAPSFVLLPGLGALALASAISSGLGDEVSDRRGGKRTVASTLGNLRARHATEAALVAGVLLWGIAVVRRPEVAPWPAVLVAASVVLGHGWRIRRLSPTATSGAFDAIRAYKGAVNDACRDGVLVLAAGLVVAALVRHA
jgi:1,4-dihydroxy-2-naphthoate octaprenyltransferase